MTDLQIAWLNLHPDHEPVGIPGGHAYFDDKKRCSKTATSKWVTMHGGRRTLAGNRQSASSGCAADKLNSRWLCWRPSCACS
jgi:hypothetical protein